MPENISSQFNRVFAFPIETYRSVNSILDRDNIPGGVRWEGMHVYVSQEGEKKTYELRGGLTNDFWEPISDIDIDVAVDIAFSTTSNNPLRNSTITNGMYQRTQLQTSGQAQVHWDNLTNVPDLVEESELSNYQLRSEKGQPNGYVPLNGSGVIASQFLPPLTITETFVVNSQAEMLALTAQEGDIAVRTDTNTTYILQQEPASTLSNWVELLTPGAPVQSVNGETGTVQLDLSFTGGNLGLTGASDVNLDSRYYTETETDGLLSDKEDVSNKATDFTALNNTLYPTTQAVADYVNSESGNAYPLGYENVTENFNGTTTDDISTIIGSWTGAISTSAPGIPSTGTHWTWQLGGSETSTGFRLMGSVSNEDELFYQRKTGGGAGGWQNIFRVVSHDYLNSQGFLTEETDPTVPAFVKAITQSDIDDWDEAFSWGNHADANYVPQGRTLNNGLGVNPIGNLVQNRTVSLDFDYLDDRYLGGFKQHESVIAATTSNITLSGEQTIDGVSVVTGDRVLVKDQTAAEDNGIYVVDSGSWTRSADFDSNDPGEVEQGASVFVEGGTMLASTGWTLETPDPITVGTTPLSFIQYAGANNYTGGDLITIDGNQIDHDPGSWVSKTNLSGATVISNLSVDNFGHPTDWTTRNLTASDIGATTESYVNNNFLSTDPTIGTASANDDIDLDTLTTSAAFYNSGTGVAGLPSTETRAFTISQRYSNGGFDIIGGEDDSFDAMYYRRIYAGTARPYFRVASREWVLNQGFVTEVPEPQTLSFTGGQLSISDGNSVNLDSRYYSENEVDGLLNSKADDANVLHTTGNETKTGQLTLDLNGPEPLVLNRGGTAGFSIRFENVNHRQNLGLNSDGDLVISPDQSVSSNGEKIATEPWVNSQGFLTEETDPVFTSSPAGNITSQNISTWNNAIQPGDNVSDLANDAGYITDQDIPEPQTLSVEMSSGEISISDGNTVRMRSIGRDGLYETYDLNSFLNRRGPGVYSGIVLADGTSNGYPAISGNFLHIQGDITTNNDYETTFTFFKSRDGQDPLYYNGGFGDWEAIATQEYVSSQGFLTSTPTLQEVTGVQNTSSNTLKVTDTTDPTFGTDGTELYHGGIRRHQNNTIPSAISLSSGGGSSTFQQDGSIFSLQSQTPTQAGADLTVRLSGPSAENINEMLTGNNAGFGMSWNDTDNVLDWGEYDSANNYRYIPFTNFNPGGIFSFGDLTNISDPHLSFQKKPTEDDVDVSLSTGILSTQTQAAIQMSADTAASQSNITFTVSEETEIKTLTFRSGDAANAILNLNGGHFEVLNGDGIILYSPNNTAYLITVDNDGELISTAV